MHGVIAFYKDTTRVLVNTLGFQSYGGTRLGGMFCQKSWRSRVFLTFSFREGQVWTSMSKMRLQFRNGFKKHEPQVFEIITFPKFGIKHIQTQEGNILWDCIAFLDDATVEITKSLGGLRAIAISHPHYYSTNSRWSEAFGGVPVYTHE
ncbi:uncharacterized protein LOC112340767 [Selaginella moellendorffii]|uniref:uncharacterized protein LOC112340767 n=1 Tax=Selaginella moellendorffii TaxID=88036 RepID=UPI000D1C88AE|nr:uncharacterized protein LOC112340767 [Selaginella moellendorffii]XP_024515508.1 uncharacterized protein LOC112340767 [Selaginella moellendorffii]|eukprot:XP_024515507.1 uncharacterized protein LOC112340767 [Selaginella moellendorffii]